MCVCVQLNENRGSLLFLLVSLRLLPMTPNWLLNIGSPIVGVPLHLFFLSVLIGEAIDRGRRGGEGGGGGLGGGWE